MNAGQQQAHPAVVAAEFMKRADMKGGEVDAYAQTFNWLNQIATGVLVTLTKKDFDDSKEALEEAKKDLEVAQAEVIELEDKLSVFELETEEAPCVSEEDLEEVVAEAFADVPVGDLDPV